MKVIAKILNLLLRFLLIFFFFMQVGKGLSKNGKAQKLALQHWLEAVSRSFNGILNLCFMPNFNFANKGKAFFV